MRENLVARLASTFVVMAALAISNLPAAFDVIWLSPVMTHLDLASWILLALAASILLRKSPPRPAARGALSAIWSMLPFVIFAGLSVFWSVAWDVSLSRWLVLLATIVVGRHIGLSGSSPSLLKALGVFLAAILVLSTLMVFLVPALGVMNYYGIQGAWKGVYWHKNHMGLIAGLACIVFLMLVITAWQARNRATWFWGALYVLSLVFVSQTDSAASYMALIITHGLLLALLAHLRLKQRLHATHYVILGAVAILLLILVLNNLDVVFGLLNRKTNLTGRVPMWGHLFSVYLSQRPWGGYGFNAFWHVASHRTTMQHLAHYPDPIVIADNGFIDILMNTGLIGLLLFLLFYVVLWWRVARQAWQASNVHGLLPFILMAYILLANLTWSLIFENEGFFMLIMLALTFMASDSVRATLQQPVPAGPGPRPRSRALRVEP